MLVTCSIGCTSHQSLILYIVAINIYNITRSNRGTGDPLHEPPRNSKAFMSFQLVSSVGLCLPSVPTGLSPLRANRPIPVPIDRLSSRSVPWRNICARVHSLLLSRAWDIWAMAWPGKLYHIVGDIALK